MLIGPTDGKLLANEVMAYRAPARHRRRAGRKGASSSGEPGPVAAALAAFRDEPRPRRAGARLPFFADGSAEAIAARVDARIAAGAQVLPRRADDLLARSGSTPLERVKAVILGQDPYPTPGDAHGLAFSYVGPRRLPPSLKTILAEMADDLGVPRRPAAI